MGFWALEPFLPMERLAFPMQLSAPQHTPFPLDVSDEVGELCTDFIFLTVGTAPVLSNHNPSLG